MKIIFKILTIIFLAIIGCGENDTIQPQKPEIKNIMPTAARVGTIVTIYGKNFGLSNDSSFILLDTNNKILSKNCLKWNHSFIKFTIPKIQFNGKITVVVDADTTNFVNIQFQFLPEIEMVMVSSGIADIGSTRGWYDEKPLHRVNITKNFYVSIYELSQYIYYFVCDTNPSTIKGDNYPVNNVKWEDAILFCNKISKLYGYDTCYVLKNNQILWDTNATGFRLPTEAEWEYFCRSGSRDDYNSNEAIEALAWFNINSGFKIQPIGKKIPNNAGIYDLHGNVSEWCWDWYDENYYRYSVFINPKGPEKGIKKVHRGGSYLDGFAFLRSSARFFDDGYYEKMGIRLVRNANK